MAPRDLEGKTLLVTGANTGLGRATATELARRGGHVVLAARSEDKTRPVLAELAEAGGDVSFLALDLCDLASVRDAALRLLEGGRPLDVLINNAGVAGQRGETKQGFELHFGTNHLGHFLFTKLLLPRLAEASGARIVNVSSGSHYQARGIDFEAVRRPTSSVTGLPEYEVSKLANNLFTKELARGRSGGAARSYALHPGTVASDAWRRIPWPVRSIMKLFMITSDEGAKTTLYCATSPEVEAQDGLYYDRCRAKKPSAESEDAALAKELWERSEEWVAPFSS